MSETMSLTPRLRYWREHLQACVARQDDSLPVLAQLRDWLDDTRPKVLPESPLGKALGYLDRH